MKFLLVLTVFVVLSEAADDINSEWEKFKKDYKKTYDNEQMEKAHFYNFWYNYEEIKKHNEKYEKGLVSYKKKITKFSDKLPEDFAGIFRYIGPPSDDVNHPRNSSFQASFRAYNPQFQNVPTKPQVPEEMDWRRLGKVTPVRDQGSCESCWAFSVSESVESQLLIKNNRKAILSPQQLIDCSSSYGNLGCNGGWAHKALNYIKANGLELEASYPYNQRYNKCQYNAAKVYTYIKGYQTGYNEETLKEFVGTKGPAATFINADTLQHYGGDIFDGDHCTQDVNHVLLVVGYGQERKPNGRKYWIIKNSWDTTWGENGYMRLIRNGSNVCGVGLWSYVPYL